MNDLAIILPVYNEKGAIEGVVKEWADMIKRLKVTYSFIVCEDGSTDGTKDVLRKLQAKYPLCLNQKSFRRGYGKSVTDGIVASKAQFILCIDSDGQCDPQDFPAFWNERNTHSVLIGRREKRADPWTRRIYSALFKQVFSLLFPHGPHDPSAPYVLFTKQTILPYFTDLSYLREGFWWGFVGTCLKHGIPVSELSIHHRERVAGKTRVYSVRRLPDIALRNLIGLVKLRMT